MGAAVAIIRLDLTASELRKAAQREKDSTAARRMLAYEDRRRRGPDRRVKTQHHRTDHAPVADGETATESRPKRTTCRHRVSPTRHVNLL